ncbi:MAG: ATP-binding protein [Candidatus Marinimicrobia bacterium]|nr:ATP-binding protein [Candidatus Neomarinimicrobiota bacterium]
MKRIYSELLEDHFENNRQIAIISGPRQTGKTTLSQMIYNNFTYLNWDNKNNRENILTGASNIIDTYNLNSLSKKSNLIIFDELHKYPKWKIFIKGFFDSYGEQTKILITGSARLNIYKKVGDSLMGRYFHYRLHPLSVAETLHTNLIKTEIRKPKKIPLSTMKHFLEYGGFPEPFLKSDKRFYNRWKRTKNEQFIYEDVRNLTNVQDIDSIEVLTEILKNQTGQLVNYSSLSKKLNVSVGTIKRWIIILSNLYYSFTIKPYYTNIPKSLIKQPKIFLWDWSIVNDEGEKKENMIASHLLKAVHFWTDFGFGNYNLYFLRDKMKREVDFLVTKNNKPWFLVEVKSSNSKRLSANLQYYAKLLNIKTAFQVDFDSKYIAKDCFSTKIPIKVPATTFLSQLI